MEGQGGDLFVAADVHYLASGGARAAAVVSADALRRVDTLARHGRTA